MKNIIADLKIITTLLLISLLMASCSASLTKNERWEGIKSNKLRVYVRYNLPDELNDKDIEKSIQKILMEAGKRRAVLLLASYTRVNIKDISRINKCNRQIFQLIKNGKIAFKKCNEDYCQAFIDFDIKEFMEAAGMIYDK